MSEKDKAQNKAREAVLRKAALIYKNRTVPEKRTPLEAQMLEVLKSTWLPKIRDELDAIFNHSAFPFAELINADAGDGAPIVDTMKLTDDEVIDIWIAIRDDRG